MTMPNGAGGLNLPDTSWNIGTFLLGGAPTGTGLSNLQDHTQDSVTNMMASMSDTFSNIQEKAAIFQNTMLAGFASMGHLINNLVKAVVTGDTSYGLFDALAEWSSNLVTMGGLVGAIVESLLSGAIGPFADLLNTLSGGMLGDVPTLISGVGDRLLTFAKSLDIFGIFGAGDLGQAGNAWKNLLSILKIPLLTDLLGSPGSFDPTAILTNFIQLALWPLNMLGKLVGGKLIDAQAPKIVQDTIDGVWNGFANLGELLDLDRDRSDVINSITGLLGIGLDSKSAIAAAEARLRLLESAGNTQVDEFNRSAATNLGANWTTTYSGGGGGNIGTDGRGNAVWRPSGASNRIGQARYSASSLTTDSCIVRVALASTPQSPLFDDGFTYVNVRMNSANDTYVRLRIGYSEIRLQAVVAGVITTLGSAVSMSPKAGDSFELQCGEAGGTNLRHFVAKRNDVIVLDYTDTGNVSQVGAGYRQHGIGMETGNRLVLFQYIPAGIAIFTAAEVL